MRSRSTQNNNHTIQTLLFVMNTKHHQPTIVNSGVFAEQKAQEQKTQIFHAAAVLLNLHVFFCLFSTQIFAFKPCTVTMAPYRIPIGFHYWLQATKPTNFVPRFAFFAKFLQVAVKYVEFDTVLVVNPVLILVRESSGYEELAQ